MFAFALAAALSGAVIADGAVLEAVETLPSASRASGGGVELVVDPSGKVRSCRALVTVGGDDVADALCRRLDHARLQPARGAAGDKAYGLVRVFAQRVPSGSGHERWLNGLRPEIEITLASRPAGLPDDGVVTANVAVSADGGITACSVADARFAAFEEAACGGLRTLTFDPVTGVEGAPVPFVSATAVRFVTNG